MGKRLSHEQWAEVGRRYSVGGESAKVLARKYRVSASAIYKRSVRDNWAAPDDGSHSPKCLDFDATVERLERIANRIEAGLALGNSHEP